MLHVDGNWDDNLNIQTDGVSSHTSTALPVPVLQIGFYSISTLHAGVIKYEASVMTQLSIWRCPTRLSLLL